jgi:prephenate dehydratase
MPPEPDHRRVRVATLGPAGTNSWIITTRFYPNARLTLAEKWSDVFMALDRGAVDLAVIAVENSIGGTVTENIDSLLRYEQICIAAELVMPIEHALITAPGVLREEIDQILSFPQALTQCDAYLRSNFPRVETVAAKSTVEPLPNLVGTKHAAIAPPEAAQVYGCKVLESHIEDQSTNETRFLVLGESDVPISADPEHLDKTSIAFTPVINMPGRIERCIHHISSHMRNITSISSRPVKQKPIGTYVFLLDLEGHRDEPHMDMALKSLKEDCSYFRILGSYRAWQPAPTNKVRD